MLQEPVQLLILTASLPPTGELKRRKQFFDRTLRRRLPEMRNDASASWEILQKTAIRQQSRRDS